MTNRILFVTGIDTDIGKSVAVGWLARYYAATGERVITQKLIQTGCSNGIADDILCHRRIQGIALTDEDRAGLTAPCVYHYPCSPHLAAQLEQRPPDIAAITQATLTLAQRYDRVLVEGAGGICVPLNNQLTILEYIQQCHYPVIVVTCGRLGSINHTLLTLQACANAGIQVHSLIYNHHYDVDSLISNESMLYLQRYLSRWHKDARFVSMPATAFASG